jgi:hypothetical protein
MNRIKKWKMLTVDCGKAIAEKMGWHQQICFQRFLCPPHAYKEYFIKFKNEFRAKTKPEDRDG